MREKTMECFFLYVFKIYIQCLCAPTQRKHQLPDSPAPTRRKHQLPDSPAPTRRKHQLPEVLWHQPEGGTNQKEAPTPYEHQLTISLPRPAALICFQAPS